MDWQGEDGTVFDPWMRTHCNLGASVIKVAEKSMVSPAPIEDWEGLVNVKLPASGSYVIAGGLAALEVDKKRIWLGMWSRMFG